MSEVKKIEKPQGVLSRYLAGGEWKNKQITKQGKGKSEPSKMPKIYIAIPPIGGWKGGHPKDNGCKKA